MKYLNRYRLCRGKDLLLETNQSITEISESIGFHQVSNFIAQFRNAYASKCYTTYFYDKAIADEKFQTALDNFDDYQWSGTFDVLYTG